MSFFTQSSVNNVGHLPTNKEPDYTKAIRCSREQPAKSNVPSLTAMAGRRLLQEAHLFFEELQADLSSIEIQGENVDQLWCLLDWHRYILALWTEEAREASNLPARKWVDIKESWETIIQATVSLNLRHAGPSKAHQRPAPGITGTESLSFELSFNLRGFAEIITLDDLSVEESIVAATYEEAMNTPLFHETAFTGLIESVKDDLAKTRSSVKCQMHRRSGIESSEFAGFIEILQEEIKRLIALSPAEEQDALDLALDRAFRRALLDEHGHPVKYLHFYHSLLSRWPLNDPARQLRVDEAFQERVQDAFGRMISTSTYFLSPESTTYTVKDLQDILALGADIRGEVRGRKDCALWAAAGSESSIQLFRALVDAGAPYKNERDNNASPLQAAARAGNLDILAFLLTSEQHHFIIDINDRDKEGNTALHAAGKACRESVIDLLLQQPNIHPNPREINGYTPFMLAIKANKTNKYAAIKKFIQNKRVDCNLGDGWSANALHLAANSRDASLKIIIKRVGDISSQDAWGNTPLHEAVKCNSKPNIEILLKHGADPTIVNTYGLTPLLLACEKHHLGSMELLLSLPHSLTNQCPCPIKVPYGYSREHYSPVTFLLGSLSGGQKKKRHAGLALKVILAAKPDLEVRDGEGRSVLSQLVTAVDTSMLQDLLEAGADVNSRDDEGNSVLHRAINSVTEDDLRLLLDFGADVNAQDRMGRTPLHILFSEYFVSHKICKILLERGANPDIPDVDGELAIPADWEYLYGTSTAQKGLVEVIGQYKAKRARLEQKNSLEALARQTKAYALKQKQKDMEKNNTQSTCNPFSLLTVEGIGSTEEEEELQ